MFTKKYVVSLILIFALSFSLFFIAGCGNSIFFPGYGKAISLPPAAVNLADFPTQFLLDDQNTKILTFNAAFIAPSGTNYANSVSQMRAYIQAFMCQLVNLNNPSYDCYDMGNSIISPVPGGPTGSSVLNMLTGAVVAGTPTGDTCTGETDSGDDPYVAGQTLREPYYSGVDMCSPDSMYLSEYYCAEGLVYKKTYPVYPATTCRDGALTARPLFQCSEYSRDNANSFVTFDPNRCTTDPLGLVYTRADARTDITLVPFYGCNQHESDYNAGKRRYYYDSFVSYDANCEGKSVEGIIGYVPQNAIAGITRPVYRYWQGGIPIFNHLLSPDANFPNTVGGIEVTFNFIAPCIDTDSNNSKYTKGTLSAVSDSGELQVGIEDTCKSSDTAMEYACNYQGLQNFKDAEEKCDEGYSCSNGVCSRPLAPPAQRGAVCSVESGCVSGYDCINSICTKKVPVYMCSGGFTHTDQSCINYGEGSSGTAVLMGYILDENIKNVPGTILYQNCFNEINGFQGAISGTQETGVGCPSQGDTLDEIGYVFLKNSAPAGTAPFPALFGNAYYYYPVPYCGNGNIDSPAEECDSGIGCTASQICVNCKCVASTTTPAGGYRINIPSTPQPPSTDISGINAVIFGTCADNSLIASELGTAECAKLSQAGMALIRITQSPAGYYRLFIAGATSADVLHAVNTFAAQELSFTGTQSDILYTSVATSASHPSPSQPGVKQYDIKYTLSPGINNIGSSFNLADETLANVLSSISSNIIGVFRYDPDHPGQVNFRVYRPNAPSDLGDFGMPLDAYLVEVNTNANFIARNAYIRGPLPSRTTSSAGWVSYTPYAMPQDFNTALGNIAGQITSLYCFENGALVQKTISQNPMLYPFNGCWLQTTQGVTITA